jgi:2,3-bisphosphoglycerate-independent phosphoglycerate mutase
VIPAVVKAVETTDACLGRIVEAVGVLGGACLVTADHGNAENELTPEGAPQTAHTTNPVPCVLTRPGLELTSGGELRDLAPTVLSLLGVEQPEAMTGKALVKPL